MTSHTPNLPDFTAYGFEVVKMLGRNLEGGRATWLAHRIGNPQEKAVIKQFSFSTADADWDGYKAHQRELNILQRLNHPCIPSVLAHFETEDGFCLVQRHCNAPTLAQRRMTWTPQQVEEVAMQMLDLLSYLQAHNPLILHRDVKPQNILQDDDGQVFLIDFGLSRVGREASASSVAVGTPGFMSPEQMLGRDLDERSDLYGLGMTCVSLLSGYAEGRVNTLINATMNVNFGAIPSHVPQYFVNWLKTMVSPLKENRPSNAMAAKQHLLHLKSIQGASQQQGFVPSRPGHMVHQGATPRRVKEKAGFKTSSVVASMIGIVFGGFSVVIVGLLGCTGLVFMMDSSTPEERCERHKTRYQKGGYLGLLTVPKGCSLHLKGLSVSRVRIEPGGSLILEDSDIRYDVFSKSSAGKDAKSWLTLKNVSVNLKRRAESAIKRDAILLKNTDVSLIDVRVRGKVGLENSKVTAQALRLNGFLSVEGGSLSADNIRTNTMEVTRGAQVRLKNFTIQDSLEASERSQDKLKLMFDKGSADVMSMEGEGVEATFRDVNVTGQVSISPGMQWHVERSVVSRPVVVRGPGTTGPNVSVKSSTLKFQDPTVLVKVLAP